LLWDRQEISEKKPIFNTDNEKFLLKKEKKIDLLFQIGYIPRN